MQLEELIKLITTIENGASTQGRELEIYAALDSITYVHNLQQRAYAALIKLALAKQNAEQIDVFTQDTIAADPRYRFVSAQGFTFDIKNDEGIILFLERCFNNNFPDRTENPKNPFNRVPFHDLDLKGLLAQVLTNDMLPKDASTELYLQELSKMKSYTTSLSKPQLMNLYKYRPLINEMLEAAKKIKFKMDLSLLVSVFADLTEKFHEDYVYQEIRPLVGVELLVHVIKFHYIPWMVQIIKRYCQEKAPRAEPGYSKFLRESTSDILRWHSRVLLATLSYTYFDSFFDFLSFAQLKDLNAHQKRIIAMMFEDKAQLDRVRNLLVELNVAKPQASASIDLVMLTALNEQFLGKIFGYKAFGYNEERSASSNFYCFLNLIKIGYLTYEKILQLSNENPSRLINLVSGYEGAALNHLIEKGYKAKDIDALDPALLLEMQNLTCEMSIANRDKYIPLLNKLDALPLPASDLAEPNNNKYLYLKDKPAWDVTSEIYKLKLIVGSFSDAKIIDKQFLIFLQNIASADVVKQVSFIIPNANQKSLFAQWAKDKENKNMPKPVNLPSAPPMRNTCACQ